MTKSVLSLLVGMAVDEGVIALDHPIGELLPRARFGGNARKARITVEQLVTMRAGFAWDEWAGDFRDAREMLASDDTVGYGLGKPLVEEPGTVFRYSTGTSQLLAGVLSRAIGMSLMELHA